MANPAMVTAATLPAALVDAWLDGQRSDHTRAAYRNDLDTFVRWCVQHGTVALTLDTAALTAFGQDRRAAGDGDATMRRRWSSLSSFYDHAVRLGSRDSNPVDGVDRPVGPAGTTSATIALTEDAVTACLTMAAALDPRLEALVSLIVRDGIKLGEALGIDLDDIIGRSARTSVTIRRNGKSRRVALSPATARAVRRCAGARREEPLFTSDQRSRDRTARRLSRFGADHLIRQLRGRADDRVTANELRRFYMTRAHCDGAALDDVRLGAGLVDSRSVSRFVGGVSDGSAGDTTGGATTGAAWTRARTDGEVPPTAAPPHARGRSTP